MPDHFCGGSCLCVHTRVDTHALVCVCTRVRTHKFNRMIICIYFTGVLTSNSNNSTILFDAVLSIFSIMDYEIRILLCVLFCIVRFFIILGNSNFIINNIKFLFLNSKLKISSLSTLPYSWQHERIKMHLQDKFVSSRNE